MAPTELGSVLDAMLVVEAVNSIAVDHPGGCACLACRAAAGDVDALTEVMVAVADARGASR